MTALVLMLAGCGGFRESRLNPLNWFQRSAERPMTLDPEGGYAAEDGRGLVAEVTALDVTPMPGGAIVTAVGLPPTQGYWDAELVAENFGEPTDGVMTYRFVVFPPSGQPPVSTPQSREVSAGAFLSDIKLSEISEIVVLGTGNSRSTRR